MIVPVDFKLAVVALTHEGTLSIALMDGLPHPHAEHRTCVGIITCSPATMLALCRDVGSTLKEAET